MSKRILLNETVVDELKNSVSLKITTKCPKKWKLIDMETGEEYIASGTYEM